MSRSFEIPSPSMSSSWSFEIPSLSMSRSWSSVIPSPSVSPVGAREDNCGIEKEKEKAEEALPVAVEDWLIGVELAKEGKENEKKKED